MEWEPRVPDESEEHYTFVYRSGEVDQPGRAIVEAVSWLKGVDARDLEPLNDAIAVHEMNCLLREEAGERRCVLGDDASADAPRITFCYEGCVVTATTDQICIVEG